MTDLDFRFRCDAARLASPIALAEVDRLVAEFYAMSGNDAGGILHIVLDDTNIGDPYIEGCVADAERQGDLHAAALGRLLLAMPLSSRLQLAHVCTCGCADDWREDVSTTC